MYMYNRLRHLSTHCILCTTEVYEESDQQMDLFYHKYNKVV